MAACFAAVWSRKFGEEFCINKRQRGRKKKSLQIFSLQGKMCKNVCFCAEKRALVEPVKRRGFMNCYCVQNLNQNKHNFLPKSLASIENFVNYFSADLLSIFGCF